MNVVLLLKVKEGVVMNYGVKYKDIDREMDMSQYKMSEEELEKEKRHHKILKSLGINLDYHDDTDDSEELYQLENEIYFDYIMFDNEIPQEKLNRLKKLQEQEKKQ